MPSTTLEKNKDDASEAELGLEPASELSFDESGDADVVEAEVMDFIDD